jgi:hypothetical protein
MTMRNSLRRRERTIVAALAVSLSLGGATAHALINPRFTPVELVRSASRILLLEVTKPEGGVVAGKVEATLRGDPLATSAISFRVSESGDLPAEEIAGAFGPNRTATAVAVFTETPGDSTEDTPGGAIQINTIWYALHRRGADWVMEPDKQALFAVWAGSSRMLAAATRYTTDDPTAYFPVRSDIAWESDLHLGKLPGKAHDCVTVDFGAPLGPCVLVLNEGGDRVFQIGDKGAKPTDITAKTALTTASLRVSAGDFNGDGRLDLAAWDGKTIRLATQMAEGTFTTRVAASNIGDCVSMDTLDLGAENRAGLALGTSKGLALLIPDAAGGFAAGPAIPAGTDFGPGGVAVVADMNADGRCDAMQVFSGGTVLYVGEAPGRFAAGVATKLRTVKNPKRAVTGDFDADGLLDIVIGGDDGLTLLSHGETRQLDDNTHITGELAYHGNANKPPVTGLALCDVNNDGRQGVAFFYSDRVPLVFFNRGFGCFGMARELHLTGVGAEGMEAPPAKGDAAKPKLQGTQALQNGQTAGTMGDFNGDGIQDMLGVDSQSAAWVLFGGASGRRMLGLAVASTARGPLVVTASDRKRRTGMYVVKPGVPAFIGCAVAGPVTLDWIGADGKPATRKVIVMKESVRATVP